MTDVFTLLSLGKDGWGAVMLAGTLVTVSLALCSFPIGLPIGLLIAIGVRSNNAGARFCSAAFSTVFRGLPELLTLLFIYYGLQIAVERTTQALGYPSIIGLNAFFAAVLALSLVLAAFSSQVWLAAFNSIGKGQYEASHVLGLNRWHTFRFVVLPQLIRVALPGLSNNWLSLLKDTSLVSTISLVDIMRQANLAAGATKQPVLFYTVACLLYLAISAVSGKAFSTAENHYRVGR